MFEHRCHLLSNQLFMCLLSRLSGILLLFKSTGTLGSEVSGQRSKTTKNKRNFDVWHILHVRKITWNFVRTKSSSFKINSKFKKVLGLVNIILWRTFYSPLFLQVSRLNEVSFVNWFELLNLFVRKSWKNLTEIFGLLCSLSIFLYYVVGIY